MMGLKFQNYEKAVKEVIMSSRSLSQKGDVSEALLSQGFFDNKTKPKSLKERQPQLSGGNPVDVRKDFERQQHD